MAKNQAVWALDIGQAALKALKLVPGDTPDSVIAEAFDFVEYPKILSQPDADPEALVAEALGTFLDRNDLKGSRVAIAVPGQAGLVKFIKLPPVEKKRIPDIVKFEAKQQIPFALEEVVWAYQQIGDKDEDADEEDFTSVEVGLFAMKRDQINRAITPFKAAGIEIDIVQMGPIALYNYITYDQLKGSGLKGSIVLLDIGADNTDLIISDGTRIWQRNVPIGGNHFTRALTKELKLTFAKAEHLKRNATKAPDPKAVFTAMRGIFNDFASEVNRSIGFYSSVNRTAQIIKVVGLGNGFKLPGLQKFLQQNLNGLEVEKLEDFQKLTGDEVKSAPQFVENLPSFAVTYGLALQGLNGSQLRTNLLPPEVEQVRLIRRKKPWALAASALLMLGSRRSSSATSGRTPRSPTPTSRRRSTRPRASASGAPVMHGLRGGQGGVRRQARRREGAGPPRKPRGRPGRSSSRSSTTTCPTRRRNTTSTPRSPRTSRSWTCSGSTSTRSSRSTGPTSTPSGTPTSPRSSRGRSTRSTARKRRRAKVGSSRSSATTTTRPRRRHAEAAADPRRIGPVQLHLHARCCPGSGGPTSGRWASTTPG